MLGSFSNVDSTDAATFTLTALIEVKLFFTWPYAPSCFSSSLVGAVLNWIMTSAGPFTLPGGRSLASLGPAKASDPPAINNEIRKKVFMVPPDCVRCVLCAPDSSQPLRRLSVDTLRFSAFPFCRWGVELSQALESD